MRYHTFKTSNNKGLLIGDSQVRKLIYPEINILSLPGAGVKHVQNFIPPKGKYEKIATFIGGNDLYNGYLPSNTPVQEVVDSICELANTLFEVTDNVFVFDIPPRFPPEHEIEQVKSEYEDHDLLRHRAVNRKLHQLSEKYDWGFWGLADAIYSSAQVSDNDNVHLNNKGKGQVVSLLKNKVLYTNKLAAEKHPQVFECSRDTGCRCSFFD